jgi:tetratricopeptide (TPR) repeat protein
MRKIFWVIFFVLLSLSIFSQTTITSDYLLAYEYYRNGEYDKASELYKKLYSKTSSRTYFKYYIDCLIKQGKVKDAIKEAKVAARAHKNSYSYKIMLGLAYKMAGDSAKAASEYEKAIKSVPASQSSIISAANEFINIREFDYAEKLYRIGQKKFKHVYSFNMELGYLYFLERKYPQMITAYLDLLDENDDYYGTVKSRLEYSISGDDDEITPLLKKELIRRIQKKPSKTVYSQLLIWLFVSRQEYAEALNYAIALDKRVENSQKIIDIGKTLLKNGKYDLATKAFKYIMGKYDRSSLTYIFAKTYYLQTLFKKITETHHATKEELYELKKDYEQTLEEYSYNNSTFDAVKNYAILLGKYLNMPDSAANFLDDVIKNYANYFEPSSVLELKLLLGDMYVMSGDPWTATIIYSRVERQNLSAELRDKAKLKKAFLAFYSGDIDWAKALADVLKGSTSKPIANDAFKLAEFIDNNTAFDSTKEPLVMYGRAEMYRFAGQDSLAIMVLDSIIKKFPEHSIIDDAYLLKGDLLAEMGNYDAAAKAYKYVADYYPFDILADNALFKLAKLMENNLNKPDEAAKYYKKLIVDYPESIFAEEARKKYRELSMHITQ